MKNKKLIKEIIIIILSALLLSLSYEIFILHNKFAPAGLNGIATIIQYLFNFSVGYMSLLINIPLCILAYFIYNKDYAIKTLIFVLVFSFALLLLQKYEETISFLIYTSNHSAILAPIAAGVITGFTTALTIKNNACTGGTDIIASIYRKHNPNSNLAYVIFTINSAVAFISYFVYEFSAEPVILCILYCFMSATICDYMLKGAKKAIKFEIITHSPEELSKELIEKLKHSVTLLNATGMYSHEQTSLLICIVGTHQIAEFEQILKNYPGSFAYISSVSETIGNFKYKIK